MSDEPLCVVAGGALPSSFPIGAFDGRVRFITAHTDEELRAGLTSAGVLYSWKVPETVPQSSPNLRWIQLPSAGADHVRGLPVWNSDVTITASKGIHTVPMTEHTFAMLFALARQVPALVRAQERREWVHSRRGSSFNILELRGRTMGIIGWGKIGDGIAHMARACGMRVVGTRWSVMVPREMRREGGAYADPPWLEPVDLPPDIVYPAAQLHEVLGQSDVVVLILPLTAETENSFGAAEFAAMKRGALFINIGRGQVVDEEALIAGLRSGRPAGAGLDVFAQEPLPQSSPLWSMPNVIVSPHIGGVSDLTRERAARFFAVNLMRYLDGQPLLNIVDRRHEY